MPFHRENFNKYGDLFRVKPPFGKPVLFTRDPAIIKHVLQKNHRNFEKSALQTRDLAKYIGHGILTAEGVHWRTHRRMVQPAFHKKRLQGLVGRMKAAIEEELIRIETGTEFNALPLLGDLAFQVVAKTLFSRSDIRDRMARLKDITERNQRMLIREMRQPYLKWWFNLSGTIRKHLKLSVKSRELLNTLIEERLASGKQPDDLLDMLLAARYDDGSAMSRQQLIDEVLILFTAGHETTANALSFTLFLLASHPQVQDKLSKEVDSIDMDTGNLMENLAKLNFTRCCIEEAMRLYPPVYVIDRVALAADTVAGYEYPKDTLFLLSIYELHRNAEFWKSAETYLPERFMQINAIELSDYYYPFGAGPRMCVGNNFAMYEMQLALAMIIQRYRLQTSQEQLILSPLISLKPGEVPITFKPR